jgi:hypothetical protein
MCSWQKNETIKPSHNPSRQLGIEILCGGAFDGLMRKFARESDHRISNVRSGPWR